MTDKQEIEVRTASKFLRTIYAEDVSACAAILNAEAELLNNSNLDKATSTLIEALNAVRQMCNTLITELKAIKEQNISSKGVIK